MDVQVAFYHARIHYVRKVLTALGPVRTARGMDAFEHGSSSWSRCFFAKAFEGELNLTQGNPEQQIQEALHIPTKVPIRFVWRAFDSARDAGINRVELERLMKEIMTKQHSDAANAFLASIKFDEEAPVEMVCA